MEPLQRTKLTVRFPGDVPQWSSENVELPIEVRRSDSALVGRTLATGSLDVGPGTYMIRAVAQGGEFAGSIEVPPGQAEASVMLRFYDQSGPQGALADSQALQTLPHDTAFELFDGHVLLGRPLASLPTIQREENGVMRASSLSGAAVLCARSIVGEACMITPLPGAVAAHLSWRDASDVQQPDMDFHLDHPQAQLLLAYLRRNAIAEARLAAQSPTLTATELLRSKKWDPLAGGLGAYVLLRSSDGELEADEELDERCELLWKYNPTFPDACCIRAESRARRGDHSTALATLLKLNELGLPFFSAGLSIAGMRLAEYLQPDALPELHDDSRWQAALLLRRLRWLGLHALPAEPILKLVGFDPADAEQYRHFWLESR